MKKLSNLLEPLAPVELAGSEAELKLPSIYLTAISNRSDITFDNKDFLTAMSYQIDIYAEYPQKCVEMAQAVDKIMQHEGWTRSSGLLIGRQRYILTYKALISEKYCIYKE